jgi:methionyl-tRNA formyltransferase
VDQIYNLVRGCNPSPGAWTTVQGTKVRIFDSRKHRVTRFGDISGKTGEIVAIGEESVQVSAQGGRLEIFTVRAEGEAKSSAPRFVRTAGLGIGMPFGSRLVPKT